MLPNKKEWTDYLNFTKRIAAKKISLSNDYDRQVKKSKENIRKTEEMLREIEEKAS
jgi:hypothetical protein